MGVRSRTASKETPQKLGPSSVEDAHDVSEVQAGNTAAFGELADRYAGRIYGLLYRMVDNREEAEDLAQETFLRAYRYLPRFDTQRPFRSWLYVIATNTALNALRSRRRRGAPVPLEDAEVTQPLALARWQRQQDGRDHAVRGELREQVEAMLRRLPARSAMLVQLHYHEGMSIREAGAVVGMKESAAKVALCRARAKLREWMVEEEL